MRKIKEPINALTHLFGAILSLLALIYMTTLTYGQGLQLLGAVIFGLSLIGLYTASTVYHWVSSTPKTEEFLRKLDHSMIYILIAGTYTPICIVALEEPSVKLLLGLIWLLALLGIITKLCWLHAPRWLYTGFYIAMGWVAIFFFKPIQGILETGALVWLLIGGILYTIGGVIYAVKPKILDIGFLGFHEIFHIFILLGSLSHFVVISYYIY